MTEKAEKQVNLDDFLTDSQGRLVPKGLVADVDKLRDEVVREVVGSAAHVRDKLNAFRDQAMDKIDAFVSLSAEEHGVKLGGRKGNLQLRSYDGCLMVEIAVSPKVTFSEKLRVAKELIDEYITEATEGSPDGLKAIVYDAFDVDNEGRLNTRRILSLRRIKINDDRWLRAMEAISEAITVKGSKEYLRIYTRPNPRAKFQMMPLSLAAV